LIVTVRSGTRLDVSVVTSGHDVADARLHRIVAAMIGAGLTVEVIGLGDPADGPVGARIRTAQRGFLWLRALRALTMPWRARGAVLVCLDPDAAIGAVPVRALRGRPLVVDVHEDYPALLGDRPWATGLRGWMARRAAALATAVAARADLTVVVDDHLPPDPSICRRRLVVRNTPDLALMATTREIADSAGPRAVYVGDVRRSRGLPMMVEALAVARGWTLDLIGQVSPDDGAWLAERIAAPDIAGRIRVHGRQPPERAWQIAGGASVGLCLLADTPAFRAALPTKVSEYLSAGMAVLATPLPRIEQVLAQSRGGKTVRSPAEVGAVLNRWSGDGTDDLAETRAAARRWAAATLAREPSPYVQLASQLQSLRKPVLPTG
jgi:hypothetical protein